MFRLLARGLLLAAVGISMPAAAGAAPLPLVNLHRLIVDEQTYPWSAIGKLFNEGGGWCSGAVISRDKIVTAAHCLYNSRTQRFMPPDALHFMVGYRGGRMSAEAKIARYEIGPGFDPSRYDHTAASDWAVLTIADGLPLEIEPLHLMPARAPIGTPAVLAGYPRDRAFAMTADRDCELGHETEGGRLLLHTCRGVSGYSGAPILVGLDSGDVRIAAIQIATTRNDGTEAMLAIPAAAISAHEGVNDPSCRAAVAILAISDVRIRLDSAQPDLNWF